MPIIGTIKKILGLECREGAYNKSERGTAIPVCQAGTDGSRHNTPAGRRTKHPGNKQKPISNPIGLRERKQILKKAILFTVNMEKVSCGMLQREFNITYDLASRLIENMVHFGIIKEPAEHLTSDYSVLKQSIDDARMATIYQDCNMEQGLDRWYAPHNDMLIAEVRENFIAVSKYVIANLMTDTAHLHDTFGIFETSAEEILGIMLQSGMLAKNAAGGYFTMVGPNCDISPYLMKGMSCLPKTNPEKEEEERLRHEILAEEERRKEAIHRHEMKMTIRKQMEESGEISTKPPRYIPQDIRDAVFARDGYKCCYCGSAKYLEVDHIIPYSLGGTNELSNLQTLCRKCNQEKSNKI